MILSGVLFTVSPRSGIHLLKLARTAALESALTRLRQALAQRPRSLGPGLLAIALLGGGAYALAAAVVTLAPDPARLPVREIAEAVTPLPAPDQARALEAHRYSLYRSDISRANDTAEALLRRLGVDDAGAANHLRRDPLVHRHLLGRTGRLLTAEASERNTLLRLVARWSPDDDGSFKRLVIERSGTGFQSRMETAPLTASIRIAGAIIDSSLFASADDAGIPDAVAIQIAEIFSGDIDFHRELRKGDRYSVVYEVLEGDGEPLRAGRVLSAEFVNAGKAYQALWFNEASPGAARDDGRATQGRGGYYTLEGNSLKRAYLASPLAFSRVTSGFKLRFHPILQKWAAHLGVDYAAPTGTPVRSVGDGVVDFAGVQGGYGNVVFVRHRNNHVTVYAHLSRIQVSKGQRVEQGQTIGAVGATGWATGPHLHYEFRINGRHQNPLAVTRNGESVPVSAAARPAFQRQAVLARQQLAAAQLLAAR
ncbi:MAG: M23 family metallopeptidase [Curvibacter sp.]|nr:M23 family metallopeptidase [Curvibacter sp.]